MSLPGENTPLSPDKGEVRAEKKERAINRKQFDGDIDQQTEMPYDSQAVATTRTPATQDDESSRTRLSEVPVTKSNYGSVDVVSSMSRASSLL